MSISSSFTYLFANTPKLQLQHRKHRQLQTANQETDEDLVALLHLHWVYNGWLLWTCSAQEKHHRIITRLMKTLEITEQKPRYSLVKPEDKMKRSKQSHHVISLYITLLNTFAFIHSAPVLFYIIWVWFYFSSSWMPETGLLHMAIRIRMAALDQRTGQFLPVDLRFIWDWSNSSSPRCDLCLASISLPILFYCDWHFDRPKVQACQAVAMGTRTWIHRQNHTQGIRTRLDHQGSTSHHDLHQCEAHSWNPAGETDYKTRWYVPNPLTV